MARARKSGLQNRGQNSGLKQHNGQRVSSRQPSADRSAVVQIDSQVFSRHEENKMSVVQNIQKHAIYKQYETRREKQCGLMNLLGNFT